MRWGAGVALAILPWLAGCSAAAGTQEMDVNARDLIRKHRQGEVMIVDVREADEFAAGHIPGAVSRPLSSFNCRDLTAEPEQEIVLQCRSGRRSATALGICREQGRPDVRRHLSGGIIAWQSAGGPMSTPAREME